MYETGRYLWVSLTQLSDDDMKLLHSRGMVAKLIERPYKGPGLLQLYWCEFESWPQQKVVGKKSKQR